MLMVGLRQMCAAKFSVSGIGGRKERARGRVLILRRATRRRLAERFPSWYFHREKQYRRGIPPVE